MAVGSTFKIRNSASFSGSDEGLVDITGKFTLTCLTSGSISDPDFSGTAVQLDDMKVGSTFKVGSTTPLFQYNIIQSGSGNKDADIFFYNGDNNELDLTQTGAGAHTANIKFYTSNYDVAVSQLGATNQSYSATFNCSSNCTKTITITQE